MSKTQRAARFHGKEDIRIDDDVARPTVGEGQVIIEPAFNGVCGTDLHEFLGGPTFSPTSPHPITGEKVPIGLGHEFSGTVKEVGPGVTSLKVGQPVAVQPTLFCGGCGACGVDAENVCPNGGFIGLSGGGGGLSEEVVAPADQCVPLPDGIGLDVGALVEPLAVAWHAVDAANLRETADPNGKPKCLVFGGGPIGLAVMQVLRARGAQLVICVEVAKRRQEFALELGAHHVLDPTKVSDIPAETLKLCGGRDGPDVVFDCAGVPASLEAACTSVRPHGTVVNVAIWEHSVPFNPNWLVFREATYKAVLGYQKKDFRGVVDALASGALKPESMITSKIRMQDIVEKGYKALIHEKDKHVKILIDVRASMKD